MIMEDSTFIASLKNLFEHSFCSPFRYLTDSTPHLGSFRAAQLNRKVQKIVQDDLAVVATLSNWLYQEGNLAPPPAPPIDMASEHYVDLEYLLGELISFKKQSVDLFAKTQLQATGEDASTRLAKWVALNKQHLQQLEALQAEMGSGV